MIYSLHNFWPIALWVCCLSVLPGGAQPRADLAVSKPIRARAPEGADGGPPPALAQLWYTNAQRSIWMYAEVVLIANRSLKVGWFRPAGADLVVTGQRLGGPAPALQVDIGTGAEYRHRFTPSLMTFPRAGLWEIQARCGTERARLVVRVAPSKTR